MKIVFFTRLHYGADYLGHVIRATEGFADTHVVLYTPVPTFKHSPDLPCPDSREELRAIAESVGGKRLMWIEGMPVSVTSVYERIPDADIVIEADCDEIYTPELMCSIYEQYRAGHLTAYAYRLPFVHLWRSFNYACRDASHRLSLYLPKNRGQNDEGAWRGRGVIYHFGYARSSNDMQYKIGCSMLLDEWRSGWWDNVFQAFPNRLTDLHPVVDNFWNAEPFDPSELPDFMQYHRYYDMEKIE